MKLRVPRDHLPSLSRVIAVLYMSSSWLWSENRAAEVQNHPVKHLVVLNGFNLGDRGKIEVNLDGRKVGSRSQALSTLEALSLSPGDQVEMSFPPSSQPGRDRLSFYAGTQFLKVWRSKGVQLTFIENGVRRPVVPIVLYRAQEGDRTTRISIYGREPNVLRTDQKTTELDLAKADHNVLFHLYCHSNGYDHALEVDSTYVWGVLSNRVEMIEAVPTD